MSNVVPYIPYHLPSVPPNGSFADAGAVQAVGGIFPPPQPCYSMMQGGGIFFGGSLGSFGAMYSVGPFQRNCFSGPFGWGCMSGNDSGIMPSTGPAVAGLSRMFSDPRFFQMCPATGNSFQPTTDVSPPQNQQPVDPPPLGNIASRLFDHMVVNGSDQPDKAFSDAENKAMAKYEEAYPGIKGQKASLVAMSKHLQDCLNLNNSEDNKHGDKWRVAFGKRWTKLHQEGKLTFENKVLALVDPAAEKPGEIGSDGQKVMQQMMGEEAADYKTVPELYEGFIKFLSRKWEGRHVAIIDDFFSGTAAEAKAAGWEGKPARGKPYCVEEIKKKGYSADAELIYDRMFKDVKTAEDEDQFLEKIQSANDSDFTTDELIDPEGKISKEDMIKRARFEKIAVAYIQSKGISDEKKINAIYSACMPKVGKKPDYNLKKFMDNVDTTISKYS